MTYALRFLGVGNAAAIELGSSSVVIERDGAPLLMVDCGQEALTAYLDHYGATPKALFITHAHMDHVGYLPALTKGGFIDGTFLEHLLYHFQPIEHILVEHVALQRLERVARIEMDDTADVIKVNFDLAVRLRALVDEHGVGGNGKQVGIHGG